MSRKRRSIGPFSRLKLTETRHAITTVGRSFPRKRESRAACPSWALGPRNPVNRHAWSRSADGLALAIFMGARRGDERSDMQRQALPGRFESLDCRRYDVGQSWRG